METKKGEGGKKKSLAKVLLKEGVLDTKRALRLRSSQKRVTEEPPNSKKEPGTSGGERIRKTSSRGVSLRWVTECSTPIQREGK